MPDGMPKIVTAEQWQAAIDVQMKHEKALTRMRDAVTANRKRLPMTPVEKDYRFTGPDGEVRLIDLFDGKRQLILQHFMFHPDWDAGCEGCSMMADHIGPLAHMRARDTTYVLVSRAPTEKLLPFKQRMGWDIPWYSSFGTTFNEDFGVTVNDEEDHGISFFLRDGDAVYRTNMVRARGVEDFISTFMLLDRTVFGRQESFENSPDGWPQGEMYGWWRLHDEYDDRSDEKSGCCH